MRSRTTVRHVYSVSTKEAGYIVGKSGICFVVEFRPCLSSRFTSRHTLQNSHHYWQHFFPFKIKCTIHHCGVKFSIYYSYNNFTLITSDRVVSPKIISPKMHKRFPHCPIISRSLCKHPQNRPPTYDTDKIHSMVWMHGCFPVRRHHVTVHVR